MKPVKLFLTTGLIFALSYACAPDGGQELAADKNPLPEQSVDSNRENSRVDPNGITIAVSPKPTSRELLQAIEKIFARSAEIPTQEFEYVHFFIVWNKQQQKISMEDVARSDNPWIFPFLDSVSGDDGLENLVASGKSVYIVTCNTGWEKEVKGKAAAGKAALKCLDEGGCATVCRKEPDKEGESKVKTEVVYLPASFFKNFLEESDGNS